MRRHDTSRGWRQADGIGADDLGESLSAEDSATLHSLMAIEAVDLNRERLEFIG